MLRYQIIAEIGQNHCGDINLAEYLIAQAKLNGANSVKFQLYDSVELYGQKQAEELTFNQAEHLFDYGMKQGIDVFFSVFDKERVDWCREIGVHTYKIAASQSRNTELIEYAGFNDACVIISTAWEPHSLPIWMWNYIWLRCVPQYPADIMDYHMAMFDFGLTPADWKLRRPNSSISGISDHTIGLDAAKIALARGALIIEKHFAIDHKTGVDAAWSMTPDELGELRRWADKIKEAL